jgi:hypothetical protein
MARQLRDFSWLTTQNHHGPPPACTRTHAAYALSLSSYDRVIHASHGRETARGPREAVLAGPPRRVAAGAARRCTPVRRRRRVVRGQRWQNTSTAGIHYYKTMPTHAGHARRQACERRAAGWRPPASASRPHRKLLAGSCTSWYHCSVAWRSSKRQPYHRRRRRLHRRRSPLRAACRPCSIGSEATLLGSLRRTW